MQKNSGYFPRVVISLLALQSRAARERSADPPLPVESTQRFAAYIDEEMEKRKKK